MRIGHVIFLIAFAAAAVAAAQAAPATKDRLDKATKNDVALNLVTAASESPKVSVSSSGTTGISSPEEEEKDGPSKVPLEPAPAPVPVPVPPRPGTMFARFIDDIFQIPIGILHSVTKLLTNPFTQGHKNN